MDFNRLCVVADRVRSQRRLPSADVVFVREVIPVELKSFPGLSLMAKIDELRKQNVRDTHFLDFCRDELDEAFQLLLNTKVGDLSGESRNATTLAGLQRALNMPYAS